MTILACDLGGTRMKAGLVRGGRLLSQVTGPSHSKAGLAKALPPLKAAWLRLLKAHRLAPKDCAGISIAFPSLVDVKSGRILAAYGKFADAMKLDLRAWAHKEFGLPLAIENDARMALAGEWRNGAGRNVNNVVMMTLGTGLGSAAIMEGRLVRGCHGQAGVLGGHLTVDYAGRACHCGNAGCAEAQASTAFLDQMAAGLPRWKSSPLRRLASLNYAAVFKHAAAGEACALQLRAHSLRVWGSMAVNLIHAYDPELLILGGGVMRSAQVILPAINEYIDLHAHTPWGKVKAVPGQLGDFAALVAGEWLLREQLGIAA